jgi:hypothetical protein
MGREKDRRNFQGMGGTRSVYHQSVIRSTCDSFT